LRTRKAAIAAVIVLLTGGVVALGFSYIKQRDEQHELVEKLLKVKEQLSVTTDTLLGYTKYTDYVSETKKTVEGQAKFLAAKVVREYTLVEHIQRSVLGMKSDATVIVKYTVDYSVGFDLKPGSFDIAGDRNKLKVTMNRPELVAAPAVASVTHEIVSKGVITDEKAAIIAIQQRLSLIAKTHSAAILREPAVIALSEKTFGAFLLDFMGKQPGVKFVPVIEFAYR
jgi:hypothetical protein